MKNPDRFTIAIKGYVVCPWIIPPHQLCLLLTILNGWMYPGRGQRLPVLKRLRDSKAALGG